MLLDTNVCIAAMNSRPIEIRKQLDEAVLRRGQASISTVSIFELRYGIAKSKRIDENSSSLDVFLASLKILSFQSEDARIAGEIRVHLERAGTPIGPYDLMIAAQAIRHGLPLITANVREFSRVEGLRLENWSA
jgi:tRNA(fMet)-specific endonuclease VapC